MLIGAAGAADRLPGDPGPGQPEHGGGIGERVRILQPVGLGHAGAIERDAGVLDHPQRDLVAHLGGGEPGCPLLHDETLDLVVRHVPGPDDHVVGERRVADPFLLPVDDPLIAVPAGRGRQSPGSAGAHLGLGQPEGADLVHPGHRREPALLLLR